MNDQNKIYLETMAEMERLLAERQFQDVLNLCETIQLNDTLPQKFWFCKAQALEAIGDYRRSIDAYRCEIARVRRTPPDLLAKIGVLLTEIGELDRAMTCLSVASELSPSADIYILLAAVLARLNRHTDAIHTVRKAIEMDSNNDEAWHNLGVYLTDSIPSDAEEAFSLALKINPDRSDTCAGLGRILFAKGRISEAMDIAQRGLSRNRLDGACHELVGRCMEWSDDLTAALTEFLMAFKCDFDRPTALLDVARILEKQKRILEAREWYKRGIRAWPDEISIRKAHLVFVEKYENEDADFQSP